MPDIGLSVTISRTLLAEAPLELNDHLKFYVAPSTPGPVVWQREQVVSQFVDGDITVSRRRGNVKEIVILEVNGADAAELQTNLTEVINAFKQATFTLTVVFDTTTTYSWSCEAADYVVIWDGPRMVAKRAQVQFTVERSPIPLAGPF